MASPGIASNRPPLPLSRRPPDEQTPLSSQLRITSRPANGQAPVTAPQAYVRHGPSTSGAEVHPEISRQASMAAVFRITPGPLTAQLNSALKDLDASEAAAVMVAAARYANAEQAAWADGPFEDIDLEIPVYASSEPSGHEPLFAPAGGGGLADGVNDENAEQNAATALLGARLDRSRAHRITKYVSFSVLLFFWASVAVIAAWVIYELLYRWDDLHVIAWAVAGLFAGVSVPLTLYDITGHFQHYVNPTLQRYYVRILWLVPIFALESWAALWFTDYEVYLAAPRDLYESFVVYTFFTLLVETMGSRKQLVRYLVDSAEQRGETHVRLVTPFCCVRWRAGQPFFTNTAIGVFQFIALRLITAVIACILEATATPANAKTLQLYSYVSLLAILLSQLWAIYSLVVFYSQVHKAIEHLKPLGKFLTIKAIVFFSFWQGIIVLLLVNLHVITAKGSYSASDVSHGIQNFLICIETAGFAISHHFYFNYRDFDGEYNAVDALRFGLSRAVADMVPSDFVVDVGELLQGWVGYSIESAPAAAAAAAARRRSTVAERRKTLSEDPSSSTGGGSMSGASVTQAPGVIDTETLLRAVEAVRGARMGRWDPASAGVAPAPLRSRAASSVTVARSRRGASVASRRLRDNSDAGSDVSGDGGHGRVISGRRAASQPLLLRDAVGIADGGGAVEEEGRGAGGAGASTGNGSSRDDLPPNA